jgi:hypothetical protein
MSLTWIRVYSKDSIFRTERGGTADFVIYDRLRPRGRRAELHELRSPHLQHPLKEGRTARRPHRSLEILLHAWIDPSPRDPSHPIWQLGPATIRRSLKDSVSDRVMTPEDCWWLPGALRSPSLARFLHPRDNEHPQAHRSHHHELEAIPGEQDHEEIHPGGPAVPGSGRECRGRDNVGDAEV